jgi:hypothetical protein
VKIALAIALCSLLACGDSKRPASRGSSRPRGSYPAAGAALARPVNATPTAEGTAPPPPPAAPAAPADTEPEQAPEQAPAEEAPQRDYAAELLGALGTPSDCLKPRNAADAPPEIAVDLEAHVLDTGQTTRGYARSPALDPDELSCVQRRLEAVRLQAPVQDAPRTITATLRLQLKTAAKSTE